MTDTIVCKKVITKKMEKQMRRAIRDIHKKFGAVPHCAKITECMPCGYFVSCLRSFVVHLKKGTQPVIANRFRID